MKNYQRRTYQNETEGKKEYKAYTKDSFFYLSTKKLWGWKQVSKGVIHYARSIEELKKIKDKEYIGYGKHDNHVDNVTHDWKNSKFMRTDEFAKKCGIVNRITNKPCTKNYISMLLKRGTTSIKNYDESLRGAGVHKPETRKKSGERFINCLKRSNIEFLHVYPHEIFESKLSKKHMILSQKIWVFKNATDKNLENFKKIWYEK